MLEKPNLEDEKIIACMQAEYGIRIVQTAFLPLGGDLGTAVYRAVAGDDLHATFARGLMNWPPERRNIK